jgi:hypothetical protein
LIVSFHVHAFFDSIHPQLSLIQLRALSKAKFSEKRGEGGEADYQFSRN